MFTKNRFVDNVFFLYELMAATFLLMHKASFLFLSDIFEPGSDVSSLVRLQSIYVGTNCYH
jgi:hypothetical protein